MDSLFDELSALVGGMAPAKREELKDALATKLAKSWLPQPGPQTDAYLSEADLLLYGGAAGGGKTDLLCGLALCEHERSLMFRRQSNDLDGLWDRLVALAPPGSRNNGVKKTLRTSSRFIEGGHLEKPGAEKSWQGRPHDFIGFDEGAQLSASKVNFVLGWLRTTTPGQRCRAVIGTNPPLGGEGDWLIEWFAPWLDPLSIDPARPGELRWAIVIGDGDELRTVWVAGPAPVIVDEGKTREATPAEIAARPRLENLYEPMSRTFIPSKLDDNRYLRDTNYRAKINAMPEPMRSALLHGDFLAARKDHDWQVIPTAWVKLAQERWRKNEGVRRPMLSMGVDVAQGGADKSVLAKLFGTRFEIEIKPGADTPTGVEIGNMVMASRRNEALVTIDLTGGWGGDARTYLKTHHDVICEPFIASAASGAMTSDMTRGFFNQRAESWWKFREALDPNSGEDVELPPDARLEAELTAPRWTPKKDKILVESKDDIRKRLGSSTDRADAVLMAWLNRAKAERIKVAKKQGRSMAAPMADPLEDF